MERQRWNWFIAIVVLPLVCLRSTAGHGRMEEPPARNAAWRFGFDVPANYDDVGLNCGGLSVQKNNGGKCGVCGDSYAGVRHHEIGGKYATNTIVRHYLSGALIDVKILLSANHKGFMEVRLCPVLDPAAEVTQECLNRNVLHIEGHGAQYPVDVGMDTIIFRVQLPAALSCSQCVLQWRYHAGNNWGRDLATGGACLGCGPQEEFYNCADISISSNPNAVSLPRPTTAIVNNPWMLPYSKSPFLFPPTSRSVPFMVYPRTSTTPLDYIYPTDASGELLDQSDKSNKILRCHPTNEVLKPLVGIENWCLQLCAIHCPPSLCICVKI